MKKTVIFFFCLIFSFGLCACGGDISDVKTHEVPSEIYTQADINTAIKKITREFARNWRSCALTEICYAGDEETKAHRDWADRNHADEVIVLTSSFDVDSSGGDGSLNPNSTYENWQWILVRTAGGQWRHVDHGY